MNAVAGTSGSKWDIRINHFENRKNKNRFIDIKARNVVKKLNFRYFRYNDTSRASVKRIIIAPFQTNLGTSDNVSSDKTNGFGKAKVDAKIKKLTARNIIFLP